MLNDAVALLLFGLAVTVATSEGSVSSALLPRLLIAVPGGAALGLVIGAAAGKATAQRPLAAAG